MTTRTRVGAIALAALAILGALMAAAGPDASPAPGYEGAYGGGLGIDGGAYIWLERAALVAYAALLACATALPRRPIWVAAGLLVAAFAVAPPLLSLDLFSYVSYARLDALHGLNPYETAPNVVPSDPAVRLLGDNADVVSAYGPLFSLLTLPLGELAVGTAVYALKGVAAAAVLATAWLLARLAADRGLDPRPAVVLLALNPLVLVHVVGGGHNDALMALLLTLGVAGALGGRALAGGVWLVAAAGVKASAAFALPFAAVEGLARNRRLLAGIAVGAAALVALALAVYGTSADAALDVASGNQERGSAASVPSALSDALGLPPGGVRDAAVVLYGIAVAGLLLWTARGADWVRAAGWAGLGLLVASSYLPPWYVILPLPLAAIARDRTLVVASVVLTAYLLRLQAPGLGA